MVDIRRPEEGVAGDSTPFCPPVRRWRTIRPRGGVIYHPHLS